MAVQKDSSITVPRHLGIIMDGNGRWAQSKGLSRSAGHLEGVEAIRRTVNASVELGIQMLTLYTFSTENWKRPAKEVNFIMGLIEKHAVEELPELQRNGICIQLMGKRQGLPQSLLNTLDAAYEKTRENSRLILNLAVNYGGRAEIVEAARTILAAKGDDPTNQIEINEQLVADHLYCPKCPDIDLIIRTGGEQRLSNFMTWRAANAVFWSTPVFWPEFNRDLLVEGIEIYSEHILHYVQ